MDKRAALNNLEEAIRWTAASSARWGYVSGATNTKVKENTINKESAKFAYGGYRRMAVVTGFFGLFLLALSLALVVFGNEPNLALPSGLFTGLMFGAFFVFVVEMKYQKSREEMFNGFIGTWEKFADDHKLARDENDFPQAQIQFVSPEEAAAMGITRPEQDDSEPIIQGSFSDHNQQRESEMDAAIAELMKMTHMEGDDHE